MAGDNLTSPGRARGARSIVLIESDALIRGLVTEWLTAAQYLVRPESRGDADGCDDVDAIIVDIYQPRDSGARIIRAVQRIYPGRPIIAISARFRPGLGHSCAAARELGARRLLAKPFSRADLLDAVRAVIARSE